MCARCRNEGGDIDFTALPKRKKKGRPVMVSAYIPTEEEERLALEMDNIEAPTANMGSSTDVQSKKITEHDKFIGNEGIAVNSEQDSVDVPTLMVTTSTITDDAQRSQTEEPTTEIMEEILPTVEDIICDSNLSLNGDKAKSVLVVQRIDTPALSTDADYYRWTEELLVQMKKMYTTRIVRANSTEAPVLQQLVEEQLASLDVPVNAATTAPKSDTDAATMTSTASIVKESHHIVPIHLCCVGLPISDALSIWQQFPHAFDKLIIIDPPQQDVSKVDSKAGPAMPRDQLPNQQMTSPSNVLDEYNATTTLVSNVVYSYFLPTAQLSLPNLMKLPLLRVSFQIISKIWNFGVQRAEHVQSANPAISQDHVVNEVDSSPTEVGLVQATRDVSPAYKLVYSPYHVAMVPTMEAGLLYEPPDLGKLHLYGAEEGSGGASAVALSEVYLHDLF